MNLIFQGTSTAGQTPFTYIHCLQTQFSWQNFTKVDCSVSYKMAFSYRTTDRARKKNINIITMWDNLQEIKTSSKDAEVAVYLSQHRTLFSMFDIPVQESEQPEHLYVYKKVKKYVQLIAAHSHDYSESLTLHNKFNFHRQRLIPYFVFLQHVP